MDGIIMVYFTTVPIPFTKNGKMAKSKKPSQTRMENGHNQNQM
jgi:hypothetical protein